MGSEGELYVFYVYFTVKGLLKANIISLSPSRLEVWVLTYGRHGFEDQRQHPHCCRE